VTVTLRDRRSARKLGMGLVALLGLNVLLAALMVVFRLFEIGLLQRIGRGELASPEEAARSDQRVATVTTAALIVLVVTGIVWLVWQHRSQANLHAARVRELEYTPGWAVGWWLILFANLVKPFQTMRELWKASGGEQHWRHVETWPLIGWWWAG
jgi:heme/copper-type cytochrome/quinol oxidase subunit 2